MLDTNAKPKNVVPMPNTKPTAQQIAQLNDFIFRNCPNCSSESADLERSSKESADDHDYESLKKHWFGFFKQSMFFNYFRCRDCRILYNKKFFNGTRLSELYSSMPDNTAGQNLSNLRKTQASYFRFLKAHAPVSGRYLELGPDIGLLTAVAANAGSYSSFSLIEPNKNVHPQLKASTGGKPCEISTDIFDLSQIPEASIDTAVAIHVFDHMLDPRNTVNQLFSKLKSGGHLLVVTHDENSFLARFLKDRWPGHCLQHPHLFSKASTKNFYERSGFQWVETAKSYNHFTLAYLIKHFCWSVGLGQISPPSWLEIALPLKLGNIISVVKKP